MIRKIIGGFLILLIFIVLFSATAAEKGFEAAAIAWGISLALVLVFLIAVWLIYEEF